MPAPTSQEQYLLELINEAKCVLRRHVAARMVADQEHDLLPLRELADLRDWGLLTGPETIEVAAAEAAIGLAVLVVYFRNRGSIAVEDVNLMKG